MNLPKPKLARGLEVNCSPEQLSFFENGIERILSKLYPPSFFDRDDAPTLFFQQLPVICWTPVRTIPFPMTFYLLAELRQNAFRFFYDMISRWLIPGSRQNILLQFAVDFSFPEMGDMPLTAGEIALYITSQRELESLQKNLPIIESEIRLGVQSEYQASRILAVKGLTHDDKMTLVQENILSLVQRRPHDFDYDILTEMQHFMIICQEDFKRRRSFRHLSKIVCVHYLFRRALKIALEAYPHQREVSVKLMRLEGKLGLAIGFTFLHSHELFEAKHILNAVRTIVSDAQLVEGSFVSNHNRAERVVTFYAEVTRGEKEISLKLQQQLKKELPGELKKSIEVRLSPVFMPQNEEEIMRHVVTLAGQLRFARDLPQVVILFTGQCEDELEFAVILLHLVKEGQKQLEDCFEKRSKHVKIVLERIKRVGTLRKRFPKEAAVFRMKIPKEPFLRQDHAVDLYKARRFVVNELHRILGEFRDYNGGMISKETEAFYKTRSDLSEEYREEHFFLENFFFSIYPPEMRSLLKPTFFKNLFVMLVDLQNQELNENEKFSMRIEEDRQRLMIALVGEDASFQEALSSALEPFFDQGHSIATSFVTTEHYPCFGLLYQNPEKKLCQELKHSIETAMREWSQKESLVFVN